MEKVKGRPLPMGVTVYEDRINFSAAVPEGKKCTLLLYRRGGKEPVKEVELTEEEAVGEVRFAAFKGMKAGRFEYNYRIDGEITLDPYARRLSGKGRLDREAILSGRIRGFFYKDDYDWEGDTPLKLPYHQVVAYSLHVKGFTKHISSKTKHRGSFAGVAEKIPYLLELGVNQLHLMPVYEFMEEGEKANYWGYGGGYFFAPRRAYSSEKDAAKELKDMVKACHRAGLEVVLETPFERETPKQMVEECLRRYRMEYHIDGFILNPSTAPMDSILSDPLLKGTKLMKRQTGFQDVMRRFLKGDEGMVNDVIYWLRHNSGGDGSYNYIANHNGFTLCDLVSYDGKHNEKNGEQNQDGPDYNYSWNCGAEGFTRKKSVVALRRSQMRNALFLVFLAQGTPCILAGDEFANSQQGNNNVYCQDNATAWLDWKGLLKDGELFGFVKDLIAFRKRHLAFCPERESEGADTLCCGIPDVSYHGEEAWRTPSEVSSRQLGVFYSGEAFGDEDCFVAYNMHWIGHTFALPALSHGKAWYLAADTKEGVRQKEGRLREQKRAFVGARSIAVFIGR